MKKVIAQYKRLIIILSVVIVIFVIFSYSIHLYKLSQSPQISNFGNIKGTEELQKPSKKNSFTKKINELLSQYYQVEEKNEENVNTTFSQQLNAEHVTEPIDSEPETVDTGDELEENQIDQPEEVPEEEPIKEPNACPVSTQNCVPCHKDEQYCRYEEGEEYGYLGWACQNNNPGNVKYSDYRISLIEEMGGKAPCGEKGGFMVFSDYATGRKSVKAYIRAINAGKHYAYPECGQCSLLYFFEKYAANSLYAYKIEETMGGTVTVNTKLSWIVNNRFDDFIDAIKYREGWIIQN